MTEVSPPPVAADTRGICVCMYARVLDVSYVICTFGVLLPTNSGKLDGQNDHRSQQRQGGGDWALSPRRHGTGSVAVVTHLSLHELDGLP